VMGESPIDDFLIKTNIIKVKLASNQLINVINVT
jgi:hypothetical protein